MGGGGGGTRVLELRATRGLWVHAPPENFEIKRLGNAISSILQELFVIYSYCNVNYKIENRLYISVS